MAPAFAPATVATYAAAMAEAAQAFADRWAQLPPPGDVDIAEEMKAVTLRIICETMLGKTSVAFRGSTTDSPRSTPASPCWS